MTDDGVGTCRVRWKTYANLVENNVTLRPSLKDSRGVQLPDCPAPLHWGGRSRMYKEVENNKCISIQSHPHLGAALSVLSVNGKYEDL